MKTLFQNKNVLITGGTGSFGKNFAEFLLKNTGLKKLIIFSRDEFKQHQMSASNDGRMRFFIGDVRDLPRLQRALKEIDIVIHAAALKQVPAMEYNPYEAIKTNIVGTQNIIEASIDNEVEKVLFISTDKAAEPINLYGATKLCAEKLITAANSYGGNKTLFGSVRYGNVIGSRGSIVEYLVKNKDAHKVKITDPEMTRFWITLEQSYNLVTFALKHMEGGEIFIPNIASMKIVDLFETLVPMAEKEIVGMRPGEKLHEILVTNNEARRAVKLGDCFVILPEIYSDFIVKEKYEKYYQKGTRVDPNFSFTSDKNTKWIDKNELKKIAQNLSL